MPKVTLQDITSGYASTTTYNENNQLIEDAFDNSLSRDGSSPNQMKADLDMNSNDILNTGRINTQSLYLNGTQVVVSGTTISGKLTTEYTATAGQTVFTTPVAYPLSEGSLDVFINGVYQAPSSYTETDTTTVTMSEGLDAGDLVVIKQTTV